MRIALYLLLIFIYSCDKNNSVKTYSLPKHNDSDSIKKKHPNKNNLSFSWHVPEHWMEGKQSSMRLASYSVPFTEGVVDISITNFSGDAGGMLANANRWRGQLNLSEYTLEDVKENTQRGQSGIGEYKLLKIVNGENKQSAFLCAVFELPASTIFVKMTASISGIDELEAEFKSFCSSFKYNAE